MCQLWSGMPWGPKSHPIACGEVWWTRLVMVANAQTTSSNPRSVLYQSKMSSVAASSSPSNSQPGSRSPKMIHWAMIPHQLMYPIFLLHGMVCCWFWLFVTCVVLCQPIYYHLLDHCMLMEFLFCFGDWYHFVRLCI